MLENKQVYALCMMKVIPKSGTEISHILEKVTWIIMRLYWHKWWV